MKVAIQGERGSFSEEAALQLLPGSMPVSCGNFAEVFDLLENRQVERAVIPIENTLAGSVTENYDLLRERQAFILAETRLRIEHNLIVHPDCQPARIKEVISHPVALQQCRRFLKRHPNWRVSAFYDTAGSVKHIMEQGLTEVAGIAGQRAVKAYGARLLHSAVEDNKKNFTRFFLIARSARYSPHANKISLWFSTRNQPGALFKCLSVFALRDISLTRIESRPVPGQPWEYSFYLDFLGSLRDQTTRNALRHLEEVTDAVKVLGCYPEAEQDRSKRPQRRRS